MRGKEEDHGAELPEKRRPPDRGGCPAAAGRDGPAHLSGQRPGRRGDGAVPAGAGGLLALCHAGNGGGLGGGYPADGGGAGPGPGTGAGDAGASGGHGAAAGRGGYGGAVWAGRGRCPVVAGRCAGSGRTAGVGLRDALDGPLGCAAGLLYRPAAGGAQRAEPAGGAERAHRDHLVRVGMGERAGRERPLHGGAGRHGGERSGVGLYPAAVLPWGGGACVRRRKGPTACRPCPAALGDPVAGGGRAVPCQRPAHGGEHAGARLPDGLPAGCRGPQCRGGPVRQPEGDGPASAHLSLWAAGEPFGAADA